MYLLNKINVNFQDKPIKYMDDDKSDDENIAKVLLLANELQEKKHMKKIIDGKKGILILKQLE